MASAVTSAYLLCNIIPREEEAMRLRNFSYRIALIVIAIAVVGACSNPTGSDDDDNSTGGGGNGGGSGSAVQEGTGRADISGSEDLTLEGDATWAYTTDISSSGTIYAQFEVTLEGSTQGQALEIRLFQAYDPQTESRPDAPDDGTYQLGSSMDDNTVRFDTAGGTTYYYDSASTGDVTLTKDSSGNVWTIDLGVTSLDDFNGNSVDVTATIKAISES